MKPTAIVLLGAPNDEAGNLSSIAVERCDQALSEYQQHPTAKILPTGGRGDHFNTTDHPHGFYTRQHLVKQGVPEEVFLEYAESTNTIEDPLCAKPILERHQIEALIIVTSDFHVPRARFLFEQVFPGVEMRFSAAKTHLDAAELEQRQAHEKNALKRLRQHGGV